MFNCSDRNRADFCFPGILLAGILLCTSAVALEEGKAAESLSAEQMFSEARVMLTEQDKDTAGASKMLLRALRASHGQLSNKSRCYALVYLGYIANLKGERKEAVKYYKEALEIEGPRLQGIKAVAEQGLKKRVTRIRHLDKGSAVDKHREDIPSNRRRIVDRVGKALVLRDEPDELVPDMHLSSKERSENFELLWEAIDRNYSFFEHKQIDWPQVKKSYQPKIESCRTTKEFYYLLWQMVRELKDAHSWLCNYDAVPGLPRFSPGISTSLIDGKVVVVDVAVSSKAYESGIRLGTVITELDGISVERKLERLRDAMKMCSSERNFRETTCRYLLLGDKGSTAKIKYISFGQEKEQWIRLKRGRYDLSYVIGPSFKLSKGKFLWDGITAEGFGYIRILSFSGREEIADEFDNVLERLRDCPGLVIDVRDNKGGFGTAQKRIIGRLIPSRTTINIGFVKNGSGHSDFTRNETYCEPAGEWQYGKPIALLTNCVTGSATDLFVCRLKSTGRCITIGDTTHGNLTGRGVYIHLPCDLVVRVSNGYVCDTSGRIIEINGNEPDVCVTPTISDVVNGTDRILERAIEELKNRQ